MHTQSGHASLSFGQVVQPLALASPSGCTFGEFPLGDVERGGNRGNSDHGSPVVSDVLLFHQTNGPMFWDPVVFGMLVVHLPGYGVMQSSLRSFLEYSNWSSATFTTPATGLELVLCW